MTEEHFSLEQIKGAFRRVFHGAGELWFGGEEEGDEGGEDIRFHWDNMLRELRNPGETKDWK